MTFLIVLILPIVMIVGVLVVWLLGRRSAAQDGTIKAQKAELDTLERIRHAEGDFDADPAAARERLRTRGQRKGDM